MTPDEAESFRHNILDLTKVWPHGDYPLREFGKLVLDENPQNYFAEIEQVCFSLSRSVAPFDGTLAQAAFSPSHVIPYFEPTADPVLQSRLFSYPDTHRHRLGVNYQQIPVNTPLTPVANFQRDGPQTYISQGPRPNYQSTIQPLAYKGRKGTLEGSARDMEREKKHENFIGGAYRDLSEINEREYGSI